MVDRLELDLLPRQLEPDNCHKILLETFPQRAVEIVAQLPIVVHFSPAVPSPLTSGHIHQEVTILLIIVNIRVVTVLRTCTWRERVDLPLRDESRVRSNPGLMYV